ncbi:protein D2-like [Saccoglossus kowalevskii]|uniref:Phosphatidylethanolamine-binding protein homolog F40A3.3-like isoform X1 n=1 Tax=Saccoglossus kowalevskii TaxID=10224 RepID=A0ABM0MH34_SACKO|nr:PREDICTED: phosphatidylethanolamine-binding protein homolog F40A3.3-like isoform X1 [Saccoglossus kowalevskii]XP_002737060.1 PREDICTED: phosphatidylethanolamine-binding protein homolog F40A3.3-like isoform X2 [Saccoglossus kowalevskii]XP_006819325.1 PREDICTED: phosphatidylethanolamine-binding protein homolog F40A3.3-like isoform X3 [Saccoglossus kowalevskii]XP_006819326.1 PREDICTED: phosphatidylethanolamine-binding protein homolog F40A3.3-like isoform X4 [Saccoglossus kowalevskii]
MDKYSIAPDVIDKIPGNVVTVEWSDSDVKVDAGNILRPTEVQNPPSTVCWSAEEGSFYTLLMTDPDAPSRENPKFREWHHWLVVNIPGCDVDKGETVMGYVGSGPPPETGLHRYIYLVYKQKGKIQYTDPVKSATCGDGRGGQKARDVAAKYNLGEPVAVNLYQAEWDDYVPKLYKKLGL